jgi:acyl-coenzyme A synthetase/AMP-(fatty) acid ligase
MIMITPLPGVTTTKPGSATFPFPGIAADVVDREGRSVPFGSGGLLVLKRPWPSMLRGIYGDPQRYQETYWSRFEGMYFAGDGAKRDDDGYFWLLGRVDDAGRRVEVGGGYLTLTHPWPGMLRGIWGDPQRFVDTYWSRYQGRYFAGDGCKLDDEGYFWLLGRVDDVMNVSGHRISTTEVESALVSHPAVAEAAVVGALDDTTGQAIIAYVTLRGGSEVDVAELRNHVATEIGAIAKPKMIYFTPDLPKTRSGKIMRRLLRDVAEGRNLGDTTTLADASIVGELQRRAAEVTED